MRHNFDEYIERRNTDSVKYHPSFFPADVLPMWVADTDFRAPSEVVNALVSRAEHGLYGYVPDSVQLKESVAGWIERRHGYHLDANSVAYCPGVIPGITYGIRAFTSPGDGVIIQTPCYHPFVQAVERNRRKVIRNPLILQNGRYEIDFENLEELCQINENKLLILCNPHNPTGRVLSHEELSRIAFLCDKYSLVVLSDEIHSDIVFPGNKHIPFASVSEVADNRSVTFISASKTFNVPGLNTAAFYTNNPVLLSGMRNECEAIKGYRENIFGTLALCTCFSKCDYYVDELCEYLVENRNYLATQLNNTRIHAIIPEGTYLVWLDCRDLQLPHEDLVKRFVDVAKLGLENGMDFGPEGEGFMRMNIAVPMRTLKEAVRRIRQIL